MTDMYDKEMGRANRHQKSQYWKWRESFNASWVEANCGIILEIYLQDSPKGLRLKLTHNNDGYMDVLPVQLLGSLQRLDLLPYGKVNRLLVNGDLKEIAQAAGFTFNNGDLVKSAKDDNDYGP